MPNLPYGIIGNCQIIALINNHGGIDWACFPRFDSPSVFARIIDGTSGGSFSILPEGKYEVNQEYLVNTDILITEYKSNNGVYELIDFAPRFALHERHFSYSKDLRLTCPVPLSYVLEKRPFNVEGDHYFVLTYDEPLEAPLKFTAEEFFVKTREYWQIWVKHSNIPSVYKDLADKWYQEAEKMKKIIFTIRAYEKVLRKGDYFFRYITKDDFGTPKTSFNICTFWYIDALIRIGEIEEAKRLYENLLNRRNHLGLLSEDIDVDTHELWGNFPQTYSLVGIIQIAKALDKAFV